MKERRDVYDEQSKVTNEWVKFIYYEAMTPPKDWVIHCLK